MKTKTIYTLSAILLFLIAGIVIKQTQRRPEFSALDTVRLNLAFEESQAAKMTVLKQKGTGDSVPQVEMVKTDGKWILSSLWNVRADEKRIDNFFEAVQKAKGELRGKSKNVFGDFGIDDSQGYHVTVTDAQGKALVQFVIGTQKADYGSLFVRKKDSEEVFVTEANLFGLMGVYGKPEADEPQPDYWADKQFADFAIPQVTKIESLSYQNGSVSASVMLEKEGGQWKFSGQEQPFSPGPEKVEQFLAALQGGRAQKILDPQGREYGFTSPRWNLRVSFQSGDPLELTLGLPETSEEKTFFLRSSMSPAVFLVSSYDLEAVRVGADWFFGSNPFRIEVSKIQKIIIHADKEEKIFQPNVKTWDALTGYLETMQGFSIRKVEVKKPKFGKYWIEIKRSDEEKPFVLDVSDVAVQMGDEKVFPGQKRGSGAFFALTGAQFSQFFDNLSRLDEPQT